MLAVMSLRKRRYHQVNIEEDDKFETEAFQYLNESQTSKPKRVVFDDDSDVDLEASDEDTADEEEKLLDENNRLADESDDDDDAPDSIDFAASKNTVMQQFRLAMDQIESEKQKKKDKRKKLDTQYKDQKAQKLKDLSESKLPEEFLQSLDAEIPEKKIIPVNLQKKKEKKRKDKNSGNSQNDDGKGGGEDLKTNFGSDYIPLSSKTDRASGVKVLKIGEEKRKLKSQAETAAEFLKSRLYGAHIPRESTKQQMAKEEKRKARFR